MYEYLADRRFIRRPGEAEMVQIPMTVFVCSDSQRTDPWLPLVANRAIHSTSCRKPSSPTSYLPTNPTAGTRHFRLRPPRRPERHHTTIDMTDPCLYTPFAIFFFRHTRPSPFAFRTRTPLSLWWTALIDLVLLCMECIEDHLSQCYNDKECWPGGEVLVSCSKA
jgi:hypothetical protein